MTEKEMRRIEYRKWHLPRAIRATEAKLEALYKEASTYRMDDVCQYKWAVEEAWEREVELGRTQAAYCGGETTIKGAGL